MKTEFPAPVLVFAYNRPAHLQKTLDALRQCDGVSDAALYVYCDGPKVGAPTETLANIKAVRVLARAQHFAKTTTVREQPQNRGLANSVINGVAEVLACHGRVIVLEDDLEVSPCFLRYMNHALDFYENYPAVFSIGGHSLGRRALGIPRDYPHDVFASPRACSWGYATWRDRWARVDWRDETSWRACLSDPRLRAAFDYGGADLSMMLRQHMEGKIDSWLIRFMFAHFKHRAVSILPCDSLVRNIGCDGSGVHCDPTTASGDAGRLADLEHPRFAPEILVDDRIHAALRAIVSPRKRPFKERYAKKWRRIVGFFSSRNP